MRFTLQQETQGWSTGMQHNFIETLEATSIYKQGNGSLLNVNAFFLEPKLQKRTGEKKTKKQQLPGIGPVAGVFFKYKKN